MKLKKYVSIILTAAMTLSMTASVFAAEPVDPMYGGTASATSEVEGTVNKDVVDVLLPVVPDDPRANPYSYVIDPQRNVKDTAEQRWGDSKYRYYSETAQEAGVYFGQEPVYDLGVDPTPVSEWYTEDPDFVFPANTRFYVENTLSDLTAKEVNDEPNKFKWTQMGLAAQIGEPRYEDKSMTLKATNLGNKGLSFGVEVVAYDGAGVTLVDQSPVSENEVSENEVQVEEDETKLYLKLSTSENRLAFGRSSVSEDIVMPSEETVDKDISEEDPIVIDGYAACEVYVEGTPSNFKTVYNATAETEDEKYSYEKKVKDVDADFVDWDYAEFDILGCVNHSKGTYVDPETQKPVPVVAPRLAVFWSFWETPAPEPEPVPAELLTINTEAVPADFEGVFKSDDYAADGVTLGFNKNVTKVMFSVNETLWKSYAEPGDYFVIDPDNNKILTVKTKVFENCNNPDNPAPRWWRVFFGDDEYLEYTFTPYSD